ncbi:hypothetical protein F383_20910 [Gossypium arboreum]|uniref:Uncharacterized protein n=1 Tax=Gossypium arboreum TaxID=29729 RepID=A0A0B0P0N7_GOSAR|nr:hypothetical protein F383_20910 [Gossypium arboreum]
MARSQIKVTYPRSTYTMARSQIKV